MIDWFHLLRGVDGVCSSYGIVPGKEFRNGVDSHIVTLVRSIGRITQHSTARNPGMNAR